MKIISSAVVFTVSSLDDAIHFYKDKLGFEENFFFDKYAGVSLGNCFIHLAEFGPGFKKEIGSGNVYIFCHSFDAYYEKLTKKDIKVISKLQDQPYGFKEFIIEDTDGNILSFGSDL